MGYARPWTEREDAELVRTYLRDGMYSLAGRLNRSLQGIRQRTSKLGVAIRRPRRQPWEDEVIRRAFRGPPRLAGATAAKRLTHRALASIYKRADCLGLTAPVEWRTREDNIIRQEWAQGRGAAKRAHAKLPRRSLPAIQQRAMKLGLNVAGWPGRWTAAEDAVVRREWAHGSLGAAQRVQAELPHRTRKAIAGRGKKLCPGTPRTLQPTRAGWLACAAARADTRLSPAGAPGRGHSRPLNAGCTPRTLVSSPPGPRSGAVLLPVRPVLTPWGVTPPLFEPARIRRPGPVCQFQLRIAHFLQLEIAHFSEVRIVT